MLQEQEQQQTGLSPNKQTNTHKHNITLYDDQDLKKCANQPTKQQQTQ